MGNRRKKMTIEHSTSHPQEIPAEHGGVPESLSDNQCQIIDKLVADPNILLDQLEEVLPT
jgi:hypothetical protein